MREEGRPVASPQRGVPLRGAIQLHKKEFRGFSQVQINNIARYKGFGGSGGKATFKTGSLINKLK